MSCVGVFFGVPTIAQRMRDVFVMDRALLLDGYRVGERYTKVLFMLSRRQRFTYGNKPRTSCGALSVPEHFSCFASDSLPLLLTTRMGCLLWCELLVA